YDEFGSKMMLDVGANEMNTFLQVLKLIDFVGKVKVFRVFEMIEHDGRACIYGAFVSVNTNDIFTNDEFPILNVGRKIISKDNVEIQANKSAGRKEANNSTCTQANDQGVNSKEIDLHEEHFVLPIWSAYSTTVKSSGDKIKQNNAFKTSEKPISQNANTSSTNLHNTVSKPFSTAGPSRAFNDGKLSYLDDTSMPHLEDIYASPNLPFGKKAIRTKWVYKNKKDERGVVVINKVRLVAHGHRQEEWIDYDEVFAPVARIKAIRIFLAFASYMGFIVYMVVKALYGLHQAPKAWYATLSNFLEKSRYRRGAIDKTLFIKQDKKDIMLVQVYVDDIIFGSTKKSWRDEFEELMKNSVKTASTPIETQKPLVKDEEAADVDVHLYRFQVTSKTSHLQVVKRIFRILISWQCKKHTIMATSTIKAEYVAAAHCCAEDSHDDNVADLLTKAFDVSRWVVIAMFWKTKTFITINNISQINAKVAGKPVVITEASIRGDGNDEPLDDNEDDDTNDEDLKEEPFEEEEDYKEEEEDHLAPNDSSAVPIVDPVLPAGDTEALEADEPTHAPRSPIIIPLSQTHLRRARKSVRPEPPMSVSIKACIARHAALPSPPLIVPSLSLPLPSPLTTSPNDTGAPLGYTAAGIRMRALLPSTSHKTDIPEADMPPQMRACLTTPTTRFEVGESSAAGATRQPGPTESDLRRYRVEQAGYGITDMWDEIVETLMKIAPTTLEGVDQRVTDLDTTIRQRTDEFEIRFKETQDDRALLRARVNTLFKDRPDHRRTTMLMDREAMYAREAWAFSKDRSSAIAAHVRTLEAYVAALIAQTSSLHT
nr:hypothetical protein [Tanacetum cinerariifolium]